MGVLVVVMTMVVVVSGDGGFAVISLLPWLMVIHYPTDDTRKRVCFVRTTDT